MANKMWNETSVAFFMMLSQDYPGETEKDHEYPQS
jgi:hypothetical protein